MFTDPRIYLFFGLNALLQSLTVLVNHSLASGSIYLLLAGPMVVLPALYLRQSAALVSALLTAVWLEVACATPNGTFVLPFCLLTTLIHMFRIRFRPENNYHPLILAHILNPVLVLIVLVIMAGGQLGEVRYWLRGATDMLFSQLVLLAVAPWFFNLQRLCFRLFKVDPEPSDRPLA